MMLRYRIQRIRYLNKYNNIILMMKGKLIMKDKKGNSNTNTTNKLEWAEKLLQVYLLDDTLENQEACLNDDMLEARELAFRLIIRIGELKALRWEDIHEDYIYIHQQTVERQVMNDDLTFESRTMETVNRMKGNKENGKRTQYLTPEAKEILKKIKQLNPNGEYILMKDGRQLSTCTYNRHLRAFCENAGVEYHSSHKIRFTSASMLYDGTNLALLSQLLGHTTTTMTLHYFRNILGNNEIQKLMSKLDRNIDEVA